MKAVIATAAVLTAIAAPAAAQDVEIRDAVARVVVIPENRADIAVEVIPGRGLPPLKVTRRGNDVLIDGELHENRRNQSWNCSGGGGYWSPAETPPGDMTVRVRGRDPIRVADAPLVTIRTPMDVDVSVGGAVWGAVGRAGSVSFENMGCGNWTFANVSGELETSLKGSGDIRAGTSGSLEVSLMGSGEVQAGATGEAETSIMGSGNIRLAAARDLEANIMGSGDITVGRVEGPVEANIPGSGNIVVEGGRTPNLNANIMGSGDIVFRGQAGNVSANIMGSGDVRVNSASGSVNQRHMGSGRVRVGSR